MKYELDITLQQLAQRALDDNYTITEKEAVDIWLLIPEGCTKRYGNPRNRGIWLIVKGLGEFKIK